MRIVHQPARIRVKLLVILVVVIGVIGAGAVVAHKARKRITAERVLAAGRAALEKEDWPEACEQLGLYLSKYPGNEELLAEYAKANLAVRPLEPRYIAAAIGAYRRLFRQRPGDAEPLLSETLATIAGRPLVGWWQGYHHRPSPKQKLAIIGRYSDEKKLEKRLVSS